MGVPLQVILGVLLILVACSSEEERHWRQIREAPPPNTTEINNRDLNKILKVNPKTENLETKPPKQSASSFPGFPLNLGKDHYKIENASRPSQNHSQHGWERKSSTNYELEHFQGTRHPSFDSISELTTPTTERFDNKFRETVKSVASKLDFEEDEGTRNEDDDDDGDDDEEDDDMAKNGHERIMEFEKTRTIVDNETVFKNSIHKDLSIEQTMKMNYKNVYNKTEVYDQEIIEKNGTTERIDKTVSSTTEVTVPISTTTYKAEIQPIIDNNIASESVASLKNISKPILTTTTMPTTTTTTTSTTTTEAKSSTASFEENKVVSLTPPLKEINTTTEATSSTANFEENIVESLAPPLKETNTSGEINTTTEATSSTASFEENIIVSLAPSLKEINSSVKKKAAPSPTTTSSATTTSTEKIPNTTTIEALEPETTPPQTTTGEPLTTTGTMEIDSATSSESWRTSKSLDNSIVAEQSIRDNAVKNVEVVERDGFVDDLVTTTTAVSEEIKVINNTIPKIDEEIGTTTTDAVTTLAASTEEATTILSVNEAPEEVEVSTEVQMTTTSGEATTETQNTLKVNTTSPITLISTSPPAQTTTEITFVHIKGTDSTHTTLLPDSSDPSLNYSTSKSPDPAVRMIDSSPASPTVKDRITEEPSTITETTTDHVSTEQEDYIKEDGSDGANKGKIAAIVISCVAAVCSILLVGLFYIMKKRQKRLNYGPRCRPVSLDDYSIDNLSVYNSVRRKGGPRMSKRSFGNPAFDDPVATSHPLNFPALAKFSVNLEDIKAEFEDIPQITARTSELPEGCDTKNRYANVIPLPETRVFLSPIDGYPNSDYINANYVTGPNNTKGYYIATQGPMQNTVDDFWRMIWEQQVKVVLMLTHLVENGLEKCVDYLPESEVLECSRLFGDFQITLKKREVKDKYIISGLQLKNMVSNSWREVTHFWYLGWPEKGVPSEANSLIAFIIEARSYMKSGSLDKKNASNGLQNSAAQDHHPVVVHCSPGTGRTGVVIACDIAIREFEKTRLVDIPKIVYRIRRDRANSVQTKEQYIFIYKVVNLYATKLTGGALENL